MSFDLKNFQEQIKSNPYARESKLTFPYSIGLDKFDKNYQKFVKKSTSKLSTSHHVIENIMQYTSNQSKENHNINLNNSDTVELDDDLIVYKGQYTDNPIDIGIEQTLSTSYDIKNAISHILYNLHFKEQENQKKELCCLYKIHLPKGMRGLAIRELSTVPFEEEVLVNLIKTQVTKTSIMKINTNDYTLLPKSNLPKEMSIKVVHVECDTFDDVKYKFFLSRKFSYKNYPMFSTFRRGKSISIFDNIKSFSDDEFKSINAKYLINEGYIPENQIEYSQGIIDFLKKFRKNENIDDEIQEIKKIYISLKNDSF